MRTSCETVGRMSAPLCAINLQFGKSGYSYQDVICHIFISVNPIEMFQIIPSIRGSHSEISGI